MIHPFPAAHLRAALLCLSAASATHAAAPASTATPNAADPQAAVPATRYRPAFDWRVEPPAPTRPDRHWQDSNAIVAGTDAMSLTMPGMADHAMHSGAETATATPAPAPASAPAPAPAAHHHHAGMAMSPAARERQP